VRLDYYTDDADFTWCCIHGLHRDGHYDHYFLGTRNVEKRKAKMYETLGRFAKGGVK
jgi:hypothetical protein